jgi:hypothetical protein
MTLKITPLVVALFGLALLLVGRTSDLQTQRTTMNAAMCVLAIRAGLSTRRSGLQSNQLRATSFELRRKAEAVTGIPI